LHVGHINLSKSIDDAGEQFAGLVESLRNREIRQYVLVRNVELAKHLDAIDGITVGPVVHSAVTAYALMPNVDIVHIHDMSASQAGLLLTLTRSIPYVLSYGEAMPNGKKPLAQAIYRRALCVICRDDSEASILRHYDATLRVEIVPEMEPEELADAYLRVYQNSQRMPIAGNSGIQ
jgi:hypothetical protein